MEHWTFNNSLPLREWLHDHCDVLVEKYVIKDGYLREGISNGNIPSGRKKEEHDLVTMTDRSLLNWPSFVEGIYLYDWYTSHVHFRRHPPVLLFNLSLWLPPFLKSSPYFFLFSLRVRRETQVSLKRASSLSWAWEESVAMGTVSMACKGAVANKTILPV